MTIKQKRQIESRQAIVLKQREELGRRQRPNKETKKAVKHAVGEIRFRFELNIKCSFMISKASKGTFRK